VCTVDGQGLGRGCITGVLVSYDGLHWFTYTRNGSAETITVSVFSQSQLSHNLYLQIVIPY